MSQVCGLVWSSQGQWQECFWMVFSKTWKHESGQSVNPTRLCRLCYSPRRVSWNMFKTWKNICAKKSVFLAKNREALTKFFGSWGKFIEPRTIPWRQHRWPEAQHLRGSDADFLAALSKLKLWKRSRGCSDDSDDTLSHSSPILSGTETAHPCCCRYVFHFLHVLHAYVDISTANNQPRFRVCHANVWLVILCDFKTYLVGGSNHLEKYESMGRIIPIYHGKKTCSKPPVKAYKDLESIFDLHSLANGVTQMKWTLSQLKMPSIAKLFLE